MNQKSASNNSKLIPSHLIENTKALQVKSDSKSSIIYFYLRSIKPQESLTKNNLNQESPG